MQQAVLVTGLGVLTPIGNTLDEFWENSLKNLVGYDIHDDANIQYHEKRIYGKVSSFEYLGRSMQDENSSEMGRPTLLALNAAIRAMQDSKINLNDIDKSRACIIIGNAISDTPYCERAYLNQLNVDENRYKKGMFTCIASELALEFDFQGEVGVISTGCTAGIDAIGHAYELIRMGEADVVICGGAEAPIANITFSSFEAIGALAKGFEMTPKEASRPFDKKRNGFVLSEGAGVIILESSEHAKKRNAKVYGEILAYASANNASHMTDLKENDALAKTIKNVLADAGLKPQDISYINAHGSSTQQNDSYETSTFKKVFGECIYNIPISSTKSLIGHPLGAASAIEIAHTLLAINHSIVPPTGNYEVPDSSCDLQYNKNPIQHEIKYAIKTANGFSGIHSTLLIGKYFG